MDAWTPKLRKQEGGKIGGHIRMATVHLSEKRYDDAIKEVNAVLELEPDNATAHILLGSTYYKQNKYEQAIEELQTVIKDGGRQIGAHVILGKIYIDQLRFAEAEAELQLALSLNPNPRQRNFINFQLVRIYGQQRQYDKATEGLQNIVKEKPG